MRSGQVEDAQRGLSPLHAFLLSKYLRGNLQPGVWALNHTPPITTDGIPAARPLSFHLPFNLRSSPVMALLTAVFWEKQPIPMHTPSCIFLYLGYTPIRKASSFDTKWCARDWIYEQTVAGPYTQTELWSQPAAAYAGNQPLSTTNSSGSLPAMPGLHRARLLSLVTIQEAK